MSDNGSVGVDFRVSLLLPRPAVAMRERGAMIPVLHGPESVANSYQTVQSLSIRSRISCLCMFQEKEFGTASNMAMTQFS